LADLWVNFIAISYQIVIGFARNVIGIVQATFDQSLPNLISDT